MSPFYPKYRPISDFFFHFCSVIWEKAKCGKSKRGDTLQKSLWARFAPGFDQHPIFFTKMLCSLKGDLNDVQWTGRMMISRKRDQCYLDFRHFKMMMRTQDVLDCHDLLNWKRGHLRTTNLHLASSQITEQYWKKNRILVEIWGKTGS